MANNTLNGLQVPSSKSIEVCFTMGRLYHPYHSRPVPSRSAGVEVVWGAEGAGENSEGNGMQEPANTAARLLALPTAYALLKNQSGFAVLSTTYQSMRENSMIRPGTFAWR